MSSKPKENTKSEVALAEEKVLDFWRDKNIFQKTLEKPSPGGDYVFYDGPPFATGLPHYGHVLVSVIKDAVPRYQTMRGKRVERRWGWDCHGLPIENIVEKDLKVSGKKEIEALGVDRFNEYARSKVLDFADHWKETIERIGRWVDYDGAYMTMDNTYIESVWWAVKQIWDKGLIYEGTRVLPYCPRCETPIANSEIAMDGSYRDISDISVYVKLAVENEPKTFLIVWTTTPWTLPGNTAVGVNPDLDYVIVKSNDEYYILAKDKTSILKDDFEVVEEIKGRDLVGKKYKPPFDYFLNKELPNKENAWKVYPADYVTAEAGSGLVHLAPAYGEEDMDLAKKFNIPFVYHVGPDGKFSPEVSEFSGLKAKPKDDHQSSDILIVKNLAGRNLLLAKEKIVHSYPHCFRCETPLFYFAIPAWFIKITEVKKRLLELNAEINWVPNHLKNGRFGKSVEIAPDWNISRNRYWASPLPFWRCDKCQKTECLGSLDDLKSRVKSKNNYFVMRHAEAERNLTDTVSSVPQEDNHLTEKGRIEARTAAQEIKSQNIDLIYCSDFVRSVETAKIIAAGLGLAEDKLVIAAEIGELNTGDYHGRSWEEYRAYFASVSDRFEKAPAGGETLLDVRDRAMKFLYGLEEKHQGQNILIVSHGDTIFFMQRGARGLNRSELQKEFESKSGLFSTGEWGQLEFSPIPHNKNFELDFHRPYIDKMEFACQCGGIMKRVPEVIDCWFESGSMPFAQNHYPFENKDKFEKRFPSDFVSEYIAQTRTWFYYMHAVSAMIFDKIPFKNVLTTGTVLAEDGEKMSKSKGNFPDPKLIIDKYGVDALRFYMLSSPLLKSEDLNFSERGVDEVYKKVILRLKNVVAFYETYKSERDKNTTEPESQNVLDRWIVERLNVLIAEVTANMEAYELDRSLVSIDRFVEDLSVWFLRRSRDRLKSDDDQERNDALNTFGWALLELSKVIAPFIPFVAEEIYQKLGGEKESVHLEDWPMTWTTEVVDVTILSDMIEARTIVSLALEARAKAGIKTRQPLKKLAIKNSYLRDKAEYLEIIADEVNVKEISFDPELFGEVSLDTVLTDDLIEEGNFRELVRFIQDLRKKIGLTPGDVAVSTIKTNVAGEALIKKYESQLKKLVSVSEIDFGEVEAGEELAIGNIEFLVGLRRA